jgi:hypothetical protein
MLQMAADTSCWVSGRIEPWCRVGAPDAPYLPRPRLLDQVRVALRLRHFRA